MILIKTKHKEPHILAVGGSPRPGCRKECRRDSIIGVNTFSANVGESLASSFRTWAQKLACKMKKGD